MKARPTPPSKKKENKIYKENLAKILLLPLASLLDLLWVTLTRIWPERAPHAINPAASL